MSIGKKKSDHKIVKIKLKQTNTRSQNYEKQEKKKALVV